MDLLDLIASVPDTSRPKRSSWKAFFIATPMIAVMAVVLSYLR